MKKFTSFAIVIVFIGIIVYLYTLAPGKPIVKDDTLVVQEVPDFKNATYTINNQEVTLVNGESSVEAAPGSASKIITKYWGGDFHKDLNADGREDVVFILTEESGGTGLFYYVVAGINYDDGYRGSKAFFIGDRISPQNIELGDEATILVNFAERNPGESFAIPPSSARSIWLYFEPTSMEFGEIAPDFDL